MLIWCFSQYSSAVSTASLTSMFVYKDTTSNETGLWSRVSFLLRLLKRSIKLSVLVRCAGQCRSNGMSIVCSSHPRRSKIPPHVDTMGRILRVGLCVWGKA